MTRTVNLQVRWWGEREAHVHAGLNLDPERTAFVLVDCDGGGPSRYDHDTKVRVITPALAAARHAASRIVYLHNAPGGEGGPFNIHRELHGSRHGRERLGPPGWKPVRPSYSPELAPTEEDAEFQKAHQNGFRDTALDAYLRSWRIDTLVMVGFSLKSCLYHTAWSAMERNYRVVVLRDATCPPGSKEFADTKDPTLEEGGWTRHVVLRLIETNVGYTALGADWVSACSGDALFLPS